MLGREVVPKIKTEAINTLCKAYESCSLFMLSGGQVLDGGKLKQEEAIVMRVMPK